MSLRVGAALWQRVTMPALALTVFGAFGAAFVGGLGGPAGWAAGVACAALGVWAAAAGRRAMGRVRLALDAEGFVFHDGERERRVAWDDVARYGVEPRGRGGRLTTVVFRGRDDRELLAASTQLCSAPDTRRWMAYAAARLTARGARRYGPTGAWPEAADDGPPTAGRA